MDASTLCTVTDLVTAATPILLATVVPVVTYLIGRAQQRPKDGAAIALKDQTIERLSAKVDAGEARASQSPAAPVTVNVASEPAP